MPKVNSGGRSDGIQPKRPRKSVHPEQAPYLHPGRRAGLTKALPNGQGADLPERRRSRRVNNIIEPLRQFAVAIDSVVLDPYNARLHPEKNLEAIRQSLDIYGQVKPLTVSTHDNHIITGNGTWRAAKDLGWSEIAVLFVHWHDDPDCDKAYSAGFGVADNRTAELARWDTKVLKSLDAMTQNLGGIDGQGGGLIGWTLDELTVLRMAEWRPPELDGSDFGGKEDTLGLVFTGEDAGMVARAIEALAGRDGQRSNELSLVVICQEWLDAEAAKFPGTRRTPHPQGSGEP